MEIRSLSLKHFRNYSDISAEFDPNINLICGENAQGKTNLLESIFFLSCAKSFHAKKEKELIEFGETFAQVQAMVSTFERELEIQIQIPLQGKRKIVINKILNNKLLDYVGTVQTVLFSPDDLSMIKEGPSLRRKFLNIAISQLKPNYILSLSEYNKLLEHKSKLLKNEDFTSSILELIDVFNTRIASVGSKVIRYRAEFLKNLSVYAKQIHSEISSKREIMSLEYKTDRFVTDPFSSEDEIQSALYNHLCERKTVEMDAHTCLIGPHRDDVEILIDGKPAKYFASQGQIRTSVLSLKLAEREVFQDITGELPILLLDDVLSELDEKRQNFILNKISQGQVFISSCHNHILSNHVCGKRFEIKHGTLIEN